MTMLLLWNPLRTLPLLLLFIVTEAPVPAQQRCFVNQNGIRICCDANGNCQPR